MSKHRSCTFPAGDVLSEWEVLPGCTPIADFTPMDGSLSEHRIRITLSYGRRRRTVMSRWEGGRRHCPRAKVLYWDVEERLERTNRRIAA